VDRSPSFRQSLFSPFPKPSFRSPSPSSFNYGQVEMLSTCVWNGNCSHTPASKSVGVHAGIDIPGGTAPNDGPSLCRMSKNHYLIELHICFTRWQWYYKDTTHRNTHITQNNAPHSDKTQHTKPHTNNKGHITHNEYTQKKIILVTGLGGLWGCEMSRIPHCLDSRFIDSD
jgi:hypothetical protein